MQTTFSDWVAGARPRTLPAAVVPVSLGVASTLVHSAQTPVSWWRFAAALLVALALQVATNYANDYSDGIRGSDRDRVGPMRLVGSGRAEPVHVKWAAFAAFAVAAAAGLALAYVTGPELLVVGACSIWAGWFYTGGKRPYGYLGFGELFVFVFFGLVATVGSAYVQYGAVSATTWWLGVAAGSLATALLVTNNLRDIETDLEANKLTLAVRVGDGATRWLYTLLVSAAFIVTLYLGVVVQPWLLLGLGAVVAAVPALRLVLGGARGPLLIQALQSTAKTQLLWGLLCCLGLVISALF